VLVDVRVTSGRGNRDALIVDAGQIPLRLDPVLLIAITPAQNAKKTKDQVPAAGPTQRRPRQNEK